MKTEERAFGLLDVPSPSLSKGVNEETIFEISKKIDLSRKVIHVKSKGTTSCLSLQGNIIIGMDAYGSRVIDIISLKPLTSLL